jgi:hypothetical protein
LNKKGNIEPIQPLNGVLYDFKYNIKTDTYVLFGNFCSLECANAYNFSSHCGSDKVWEINSLIQMLSKHYGYTHPIRPAPSRFLLKIFNGPMSIDEFREYVRQLKEIECKLVVIENFIRSANA